MRSDSGKRYSQIPNIFLTVSALIMSSFISHFSHADTVEFGLREPGGPYIEYLFVRNYCDAPHTVKFAATQGTWLKISGTPTLEIPADDVSFTGVTLNLTGLKPGTHTATVTLSCTNCASQCAQSVETKNLIVTIPSPAIFGSDPADKNFAGLVAGQPVNHVKWLLKVVDDIEKSSFGKTSRGKKIISVLKKEYLDENFAGDDFSDITIVPTVDDIQANGKLKWKTPAVDDEATLPGNAAYVREQTFAYIWMEEIFIGVDQSLKGITEARKSPADYYAFTYKGKLSVIKKAALVHNIIHEGLHAVQDGDFNTGGGACLEEEKDATKAGNDAVKALNLVPEKGTLGYRGSSAISNPAYKPLALNLSDLPDIPTDQFVVQTPETFSECNSPVSTDCISPIIWTLSVASTLPIMDLINTGVDNTGQLDDDCETPEFLGPLSSFTGTDNPFQSENFEWSDLENFNRGGVNAKGVSSEGQPASSFGEDLIDSVDGDSWWGNGSLSFEFSPEQLDGLPTHVGLVWTDGSGTVLFEAWGPCGYLGKSGPHGGFPDGDYYGRREEDRFFGVITKNGITKIKISNTIGGIEVDNLQLAKSGGESCDEDAEQTLDREEVAVSLLQEMQDEWILIGSRFPSNNKLEYKKSEVFIDEDEEKSVVLVEQVLKNGAIEDDYLHKFDWELYKTNVLYGFTYINICHGRNFDSLYRSLKKQRSKTADRLAEIERLSNRIGELLTKDEDEFREANKDNADLEKLLISFGLKIGTYSGVKLLKESERIAQNGVIARTATVFGFLTAVHDMVRAGRGVWDYATMEYLLPRLLERTEVLAYLNALIMRYENHLEIQDRMIESLEEAHFEHDCEKCQAPR